MYPQYFPNTQSVNSACNVVSYGATTNNVYFDNFGFFHNTIFVAALLANYGSVANLAWCIDSGATYHVTRDAGILSQCSIYNGTEKLHIENGIGLPIHDIGCCW